MEQTVLIVDDDVNARIIAETLLRTRGLTVRSAADGPEACDIVRRDGAAVVVLPLAFPGVNGFEVIRCLRARFGALTPSMQPCILAVSNGTNAAVERFALRLGADACLPKTMLPRKFVSTVEQLMATAVQRNGETSV